MSDQPGAVAGVPVVGADKRPRLRGCCGCGGGPPTNNWVRCAPCSSGLSGQWWVAAAALGGRPCVMAQQVINSVVRCFVCGTEFGQSATLPGGASQPVVAAALRDCCDCEEGCVATDPNGQPVRRRLVYFTEGWFLAGAIGEPYPRCCYPTPACYRWQVEGEDTATFCPFEVNGVQYGGTTVVERWSVEVADSCQQAGLPVLVRTWQASGGFVAAGGNATWSEAVAVNTGTSNPVPDRALDELQEFGGRGSRFVSCDPNSQDSEAAVVSITRRVEDCVAAEVEYAASGGGRGQVMPGPAGLAGLRAAAFVRRIGGSTRERKWVRRLHVPGVHVCGGSCSTLAVGQVAGGQANGDPMEML